MTFTAQLDELLTALRVTRSRLLAPIDHRQQVLPRDPSIFAEDVLHFVMDQWSDDLRKQGHVLEEDTAWKDPVSLYPHYTLRMAGGDVLDLLFTGTYPGTLFLTISKGQPRRQQFSDARAVQVPLNLSTDPNALLHGILHGIRTYSTP